MQDPVAAGFQGAKPMFPEPEQQQLKCPRCESTNTKFCYYNNYNLSQPRHFCKNCRRYWTRGGALRDIPVGGGSRKNSKRSNFSSYSSTNPKRPSTSSSDPPNQTTKPDPISVLYTTPMDPDDKMLEITGSFSSLLQSNTHFGNLSEGFQSGDSGVGCVPDSSNLNRSMQSSNGSSGSENPPPPPLPENFMGWAGGWPDLAIYTPSSSFR